MKKKNRILLAFLVAALLVTTACTEKSEPKPTVAAPTQSEKVSEPTIEAQEPVTPVEETETSIEETDSTDDNTDEAASEVTNTPDPEPEASEDGFVKKTQYYDDDNGVYAFEIILNDTVPDKGTIEILFYDYVDGAETQVCDYEAVYERSNGLYDIYRTFDGNIDVNDHQKSELKVPVTFGATIRAKRLVTTLITEDGTRTELYSLKLVKTP